MSTPKNSDSSDGYFISARGSAKTSTSFYVSMKYSLDRGDISLVDYLTYCGAWAVTVDGVSEEAVLQWIEQKLKEDLSLDISQRDIATPAKDGSMADRS